MAAAVEMATKRASSELVRLWGGGSALVFWKRGERVFLRGEKGGVKEEKRWEGGGWRWRGRGGT